MDKLLDDVERNKGNWNSRGMAILGVDSSVICLKGDVPREFIDYYMKFPISEMHEGDSIHNKNSFLMRITDKTAVLVILSDEHFARLAAINLRGRISALHDFYLLDLDSKDRERILRGRTIEGESSILGNVLDKIKCGEIAADVAINDWLNTFISKVKSST
ncbi:MAG: hypothetical protein ACUVXA_17970 [Candidatus Jordarchaeum sp.]|uniref:hypothetical protein n=1 Tax=Candidatus Jordarchaeum sp. TaxID=2823881 RepID=UPI0040496AB9